LLFRVFLLFLVKSQNSPASTADYQAQNAHINAFIQQMTGGVLHLTEWTTTTVPQIAQGVYLRHAGVLYIVDTADFDIATGDLSGAGTYYIKLTTSGDSLAVAWEDTLTSYAWSVAYQGLYNGTSQILPYSVVYDGASGYGKSRILNPMSESTAWVLESYSGAITCTTLNTGHGANELYAMDQDVETTDDVTFASVTADYKSGTIWTDGSNPSEDDVFEQFKFVPVGTTIMVSGALQTSSDDYIVLAVQRSNSTTVIIHAHKIGVFTTTQFTCVEDDTTEAAIYIGIAY